MVTELPEDNPRKRTGLWTIYKGKYYVKESTRSDENAYLDYHSVNRDVRVLAIGMECQYDLAYILPTLSQLVASDHCASKPRAVMLFCKAIRHSNYII